MLIERTLVVRGRSLRFSDLSLGTIYFTGYFTNLIQVSLQLGLSTGGPQAIDTETTILAACVKWGKDVSKFLLGEYAIIFDDSRSSDITLIHDELGLRSLFYKQTGASLTASFCLMEFMEASVSENLDEEFLCEVLTSGSCLSNRTPYAGVSRLLPGQSIVFHKSSLRAYDCWSLGAVQPIFYKNENDYADHLLHLLTEAISAALPRDGQVWCELSGGLDSSTVTALAARFRAPSLSTVSFVYSVSARSDERTWIDAMLTKFPLRAHQIDGDAYPPFTSLPRTNVAEPTLGLNMAGLDEAYSDLISIHKPNAVLTGMGGDDVFLANYLTPYHVSDLLRKGALAEATRAVRLWTNSAFPRHSVSYWLWNGGVRPLLRRKRNNAPLTLDWLQPKAIEIARATSGKLRLTNPPCDSITQSYYYGDIIRTAMAVSRRVLPGHGAILRNPLFYRPLIEFFASIPWQVSAMPGESRRLQRRAMTGILPEAICRRSTKPDLDQVAFRGIRSTQAWFNPDPGESELVARGLLDGAKWQSAIEKARYGFVESSRHFTAAADLDVWLRRRGFFA